MSDVIAALSTAPGIAGIGIVRVSGEGCFKVCSRVFRPGGGRSFEDLSPRRLYLGTALDAAGRPIDRCMAVRFVSPHSYTGEDAAEFHCHGSPVVLRELLSALFAAGARQARAGEFTERAFFSGRMDLTEAEAVGDLIHAASPAAARNALAQLGGALRRRLAPIEQKLLDVCSRFYAVVDYPDEDISDVQPQEIAAALDFAEAELTALIGTARSGRLIKSGLPTVLLGRPNSGKSALFNRLAGFDRAIVTDIPGTTRDTLEENVLAGETLLRLVDTAGLRVSGDAVEQLGVARSERAAEEAELALVLIDAAAEPTDEDLRALRLAAEAPKYILLRSRCDLCDEPTALRIPPECPAPLSVIRVSSKTGEGLEDLKALLSSFTEDALAHAEGQNLTDARQEDASRRALAAVRRAKEAFAAGFTPDAILTDAEEALSALGELDGRTAREEITAEIFSKFCVGK